MLLYICNEIFVMNLNQQLNISIDIHKLEKRGNNGGQETMHIYVYVLVTLKHDKPKSTMVN